MNYLTEYYRNKSIVLEQRVQELQAILVLIENNQLDYLEEDWRQNLAKLVGGVADEIAIAAGKRIRWSTKLHPDKFAQLIKDDLLKFVGPPLKWIRPGGSGIERTFLLKKIPMKDGEYFLYEAWFWDDAAKEWVKAGSGTTPWGRIGKSGYVEGPSGLTPGPDGKWFNPNAKLSANVGDSGPLKATRTAAGGNGQTNGAGDSDEEITI